MAPRIPRETNPFERDEITAQTRMALVEERLSNVKEDVADLKEDVAAVKAAVGGVQTDMSSVRNDVASIKASLQSQTNSTFLTKAGSQTLGGILMAALLYLLQHYGLAPKEQPITTREVPAASAAPASGE